MPHKVTDLGPTIVTGGAGFIGSHITEKLISMGESVTVIDNFSSGSKQNLERCENNKLLNLIKADLNTDQIKFDDIKNVFHLAAYPEVSTGFENPGLAYKENIENTFKLLESIRKSNVENLVFASSSVVYGEPEKIPTPESYGPLLPISAYGGSKLACEGLISSYCNNYGIRCSIVRFANVIGSRSNHGVIWDFTQKLLKNIKKLEILGDGTQSKSYIHVNDCIDGILMSLEKSKKNIDVFNIGNNDSVDVLTIAKVVCNSLSLENVKFITTGGTSDGRGWVGDVKHMLLDASKMKNLGWTPKLSSLEAVEFASKEILQDIRNTDSN